MAVSPGTGEPSVEALRRIKEAETAGDARLKEARERAEKEKARAQEQAAEELKRAREAAESAERDRRESSRREAQAEAARILAEAESQARTLGQMTEAELDDRFPEVVTALFGDLWPPADAGRPGARKR